MGLLLSVCIPTYNRAGFIRETLDSIIGQATEEVEIVVSDNASDDDTVTIIADYQSRFPRLTFFRWDRNMGSDRNFQQVVDLAKGTYCWFMGSDDIAEPGALEKILAAIRTYGPVAGISVNGNAYKLTFDHKFGDRLVHSANLTDTRLLQTVEDIFAELGEYFGYMSGQIINRALWRQAVVQYDPTAYFNAYAHVYVIGRMVQLMPRWLYLDDRCVGWRGGNDSYLAEHGRFNRFEIIVSGFRTIAKGLFGEKTPLYDLIMTRMLAHHVFASLCLAKRDNVSADYFARAFTLCCNAYWRYPLFWLKVVPVFLTPRWLFMLARYCYKQRGA